MRGRSTDSFADGAAPCCSPLPAGFCQAPGLPRSASTGGTLTTACFMFLMKPHPSPFCNSQSDQEGQHTRRPQAKASFTPACPSPPRQRPGVSEAGLGKLSSLPRRAAYKAKSRQKQLRGMTASPFPVGTPSPLPTVHHTQERSM